VVRVQGHARAGRCQAAAPLYDPAPGLHIIPAPERHRSSPQPESPMAPANLVAPVFRLIGYLLFLVWCTAVAVALTVAGLVRLGRLAGRLGGWEPA
jgi:hypothetical protein